MTQKSDIEFARLALNPLQDQEAEKIVQESLKGLMVKPGIPRNDVAKDLILRALRLVALKIQAKASS